MSEEKITYEDFKQYEFVFAKVPSLLLGTMIKTNANLVGKFESMIVPKLANLNEVQQKQLNTVINMNVDDIQALLSEAYTKSGKKQYKQLADKKAAKFIEKNMDELKKLL